jgi:hypothetical protein
MQDKKGYFHFQKKPHYLNVALCMRWGQARTFYALTEYFPGGTV